MFDEIGKKFKRLAMGSFIVEAAAAVICGIILLVENVEWWIALLVMCLGPVAAWIMSWFLYGFGEIIDRLCAIDRNTRAEVKSNAQIKYEDEKISQLEKLRKKNLITEEEYKKKYDKI